MKHDSKVNWTGVSVAHYRVDCPCGFVAEGIKYSWQADMIRLVHKKNPGWTPAEVETAVEEG
jgi:hypothetical protein